jgi:hypothetical protein
MRKKKLINCKNIIKKVGGVSAVTYSEETVTFEIGRKNRIKN